MRQVGCCKGGGFCFGMDMNHNLQSQMFAVLQFCLSTFYGSVRLIQQLVCWFNI